VPGKTDTFSFVSGYAPLIGDVPEPSRWAMMLLGFARLGLMGYRATRGRAQIAA
jgi:hypothetical protein